MAKKVTTEETHPITAEEHKKLNTRKNPVNDALGLPLGDQFDIDLTEILESNPEESGETVAIAFVDFDEFMHINKDFGVEEGDRVLIATGEYIKKNAPKEATVYRIGGDEFGMIFKGFMEREDIFLFLNDLKNNFDVTTPDGEGHSLTIGMATAFVDATRCAELIRKADGALFRAKNGGRNKVAMAREEKMIPKTSHYTQDQLQRLSKLANREGIGEAFLLREALDLLLKKYDV
ncbi:GGDEF domain-containing protein [Butyrivibrio sp. WCD3002]|uniref:GGDEF domain-containing protein n=1 Tax=Butyrivibrio sp. WCD3002 TaxID=1280676 RepID=UPI00040E203D|nr:GGDEF domain-containing protein [Butyrivibrio sp. WCD3002]